MQVAFAADTASITTMEFADNIFMLAVPGAMTAGLTSGLFWASLAASLVVAFFVALPLNRWLISRGKGHAIAHEYHTGHQHHAYTIHIMNIDKT
jgi:predicted ABC-type sugar transport system permease subunit